MSFGSDKSRITIRSPDNKSECIFPLRLDDGLYSVDAFPVSQNDRRLRQCVSVDITLETDTTLSTASTDAKLRQALQLST